MVHSEQPRKVEQESAEILIRCTDVSHEHRRQRRSRRTWRDQPDEPPTVTALDDISLTVARGETVGIAGPSGSGKSTLLHLLAGLTTPTAGRVELVGTDLTPLSTQDRATLRRNHLGFVFQRFHLLPSLSARANVALPLIPAGVPRSTRQERAVAVLEDVGLADRALHTPGELSGGEQQRVAIARALVTDPDVILADEPTGELDTETGTQVLRLLQVIADETAIVVASHDDAALAIADRVNRLHDGSFVSESHGW